MTIHLASLALAVCILLFGLGAILVEGGEEVPWQLFCLASVVAASIALGMRIEAGVF